MNDFVNRLKERMWDHSQKRKYSKVKRMNGNGEYLKFKGIEGVIKDLNTPNPKKKIFVQSKLYIADT